MSPPMPPLVQRPTKPTNITIALPPPTTSTMPSPTASDDCLALAAAALLLLPLVFLLRALLGPKAPATQDQEEDGPTPPCTPDETPSSYPQKRVRWLLRPFPFASLPPKATTVLLRLLNGSAGRDTLALAATNARTRRAILRALPELSIARRSDSSTEDHDDDTALLALLAQLNPEKLRALRVSRKGIATTLFLDALQEGPAVMPCLYSAALATLCLNLAGASCAETRDLLACLAPSDPAIPLPAPRLTQLLLRHVPTAEADGSNSGGGGANGEGGDENEGLGPALAALVEMRAARGAAPLERLAGGVWRADAASLRRILKVVLPSLRWLECGGASAAHVSALALLAEQLGTRRTRHRPGADALTSLSVCLAPTPGKGLPAGMARAVGALLHAVAAGAAPCLESLTLQGLSGEVDGQEAEVWLALAAVLSAPAAHKLRALTVMDCGGRGGGKSKGDGADDGRWRGLLALLAADVAAGDGAMGGAPPRKLRVKVITQGRTYSLLLSVGAGGDGGGGAAGQRRRSSKGCKS